jgi:hypothetical protein
LAGLAPSMTSLLRGVTPGITHAPDTTRNDAPSVLSPEIVIPSAEGFSLTLQSICAQSQVLLPERLPGRLLLRPKVARTAQPSVSLHLHA